MSDRWETPDVAEDGSIEWGDREPVERDDNTESHGLSNIQQAVEPFIIRQRNAAWTLVRLTGFAAIGFGAFRLFGIGIYDMNGLGPIAKEVFTTVYLPGPWGPEAVVGELAWIWMALGIAIVGLSTRR